MNLLTLFGTGAICSLMDMKVARKMKSLSPSMTNTGDDGGGRYGKAGEGQH